MHVERASDSLGRPRDFCRSAAQWEKHLVVFPQRRTIEMAIHICRVHGGHIPVPMNLRENGVSKANKLRNVDGTKTNT